MYNVINTMASLDPSICGLISQVSIDRLEKHVKKIEGLRHGWENYDILAEKAGYIEETFRSLNVTVENQEVIFHGRTYRNIIATKKRPRERQAVDPPGGSLRCRIGKPRSG